jgi:hypothetical protein
MGENIVTTPVEQASERAIIEAATPGPWEVDATKGLGAYGVYHGLSTDRPSRVCSMLPGELPRDRRDANAAFIAAARTGWPKALDERDAAIARAERAEARLAECERERDWAQLLARAVLGCSISTYEACDQTIGIFSRTKMLWADWDGIGETDAKSSLPKETPELRAAIEAAIKVPEGGFGQLHTKSLGVFHEAEVRELREEITRLRAALESKGPPHA